MPVIARDEEMEDAMSAVIGDTLPLAVAVAISPLSIIALIMVLLSRRARSNSPAYLLGWVAGLALAVAIVLGFVGLLSLAPGESDRTVVSALKLLVGAALLIIGVRRWQRRVKPGQEPDMPRWMASIDTFTPAQAFGLAMLLSSVGNIALILAAGLDIGRARLALAQEIGAAAIFVIVASLTVAGVVVYHVFAHERASLALDSWKIWLLANNAALTTALLVVVGALLIGKGISGLNLLG
jgi:hypothetical protein